MAKILLGSRVYIPKDKVNEQDLEEHYERHLFNQKICNRCKVFTDGERPSSVCSTCEKGYLGFYKDWSQVAIKGKSYYSVPIGDLDKVAENLSLEFNNDNVIDARCDAKVKWPLTFTGSLFTGKELRHGHAAPNQVRIIKDFWEHKSGIIVSPPRSGKTVIGVFIQVRMRRRMIILAHEKELLRQFYKTFLEFTDLKKQRKLTGKRIVILAKNKKDLEEDCDVLLINYQQFISEMGVKRVTKFLQKRFGAAMVDEIHRGPADKYIELLNRLDCKSRIGLTATPKRKDQKFFRARLQMGPIVAKGTVGALVPRVIVHKTDFKPKYEWKGRSGYTKCCGWLFTQKERNIMLIKQIFKDLRANPRNSIIIPALTVKHMRLLVKMINKQARFNNENRDEDWPEELATVYWGGSDKEAVLKKVKSRKVRVVVAIRKMVQDGLNVEPWNIMYLQFPMNNETNFYQMTQRICTPAENKPDSVLRMYVDDMSISINCFKNTMEHVQKFKYQLSDKSREKAEDLLAMTKVGNTWTSPQKVKQMW